MSKKAIVGMMAAIGAILVLGYWGSPSGEPVIPSPDRMPQMLPSFARDIQPLFQNRCTRCHNPQAPPAGLDLTSYEGVMRGTAFGSMVWPGNPDMSNLLVHLRREVDPTLWKKCQLEGISPRSSAVKDLERWIAQGARDN